MAAQLHATDSMFTFHNCIVEVATVTWKHQINKSQSSNWNS